MPGGKRAAPGKGPKQGPSRERDWSDSGLHLVLKSKKTPHGPFTKPVIEMDLKFDPLITGEMTWEQLTPEIGIAYLRDQENKMEETYNKHFLLTNNHLIDTLIEEVNAGADDTVRVYVNDQGFFGSGGSQFVGEKIKPKKDEKPDYYDIKWRKPNGYLQVAMARGEVPSKAGYIAWRSEQAKAGAAGQTCMNDEVCKIFMEGTLRKRVAVLTKTEEAFIAYRKTHGVAVATASTESKKRERSPTPALEHQDAEQEGVADATQKSPVDHELRPEENGVEVDMAPSADEDDGADDTDSAQREALQPAVPSHPTKHPKTLRSWLRPHGAPGVSAERTSGVTVVRTVVGVPVVRPAFPKEGRDPTLFAPPSSIQQVARYAGMCTPLKKYLMKRKLWGIASSAHWRAIGDWCKTTEGISYLKESGLDPESFHLDHVRDKKHTPLHHAYNCVFMPGGANSHFKDRSDAEKMAYVGEHAAKVSAAAVKFVIEQASKGIDMSKFNAATALMA